MSYWQGIPIERLSMEQLLAASQWAMACRDSDMSDSNITPAMFNDFWKEICEEFELRAVMQ